jgi:lysozyme
MSRTPPERLAYRVRLLQRARKLVRRRKRLVAQARAALKPERISSNGLEIIAGFEGFVRTPYDDAAGHATIGFGHLLHHGPVTDADRQQWGTISRAKGLALLGQDVRAAEQAVHRFVTVDLTQSQFDALVSFAFNVGARALQTSTLLRKLNAGDRQGAANEFLRWTQAGGREVPGLVRRRSAERTLFLTP